VRCQTLRSCGPTLKRLKRDLDSTKPVESRELHPQRGILEGNRLVAVQQESNEVNETQQKVCHGVASIAFTVKVLSAGGIMAMHRFVAIDQLHHQRAFFDAVDCSSAATLS